MYFYFFCISYKNRKNIKKIFKILFIFFLVILSLPTISYFVIQQHDVQEYLVQKISAKLSTALGTSVTIREAKIDLFINLHLKDFCILDKREDTLLYVPDFMIRPSAFSITSRQVGIEKIVMKYPKINFYIDSTHTINLKVIIDKLGSKDTTNKKPGWVLLFRDIQIIKGDFRLRSFYSTKNKAGLNFTDLHLSPLDIHIKRLSNAVNGIEIKIKNFSTRDHSGFEINQLTGRVQINSKNLTLNNVKLVTPQSNIDANQIRLNFPSFNALGGDQLFDHLKIYTDFNVSQISSVDLGYFIPFMADYPINVKFSGAISGLLNDLKGRNIEISYGKSTRINANFDISGLPKIRSSFLHINIKNLITSPDDIQSIKIPNSKNGHLIFPGNFSKISYFTYKGKFTGFISDFVAYGTIKTNLGTVESDLSFKPDSINKFFFEGKLKMHQFQLGRYIAKENLIGNINLNVMAKGYVWESKKFSANLDGVVSSILYNGYTYQNLKVDGSVTNNTFDGAMSIIDPNINMNFSGRVNIAGQIPVFNFTANVKHIDLYKLNFEKKDTGSSATFLATAKFEGNTIDNLKGEINLWNLTYKKTGKEIQINDFLMFTQTVNDTNRIIMRSDLVDAEIWGTYKFSDLATSFKSMAKKYMPAFINDTTHFATSENDFAYEIDFKNTKPLTDFFLPGFYISKDSKLKGNYHPGDQEFDFLFSIPLLQHQGKKWYNVYFNGKASKDSFSLISGCNNLKLSNQLRLDNFTMISAIKNDSMNLVFRWNNWDTISYKGNINLKGYLSRPKHNDKLTLSFLLNPSQLVLRDTVWTINTGLIKIDSIGFSIDRLALNHENQSVNASGRISKNESDIFSLDFTNVNLGNFKTIANSNKLQVDGVINGTAKFSDLLNNPEVYTSLTIDSLKFNNQMLGNTSIVARWNSLNKDITLNLTSKKANVVAFNVKGVFQVIPKSFDFTIDLGNINMQIIEPYVANIFSDIRGTASGTLKLTGTTDNPLLNGNIYTPKTSLVVNYLKTKYNISSTFPVVNNAIRFKNTEVLDIENNKAYIRGEINYRRFKELAVDLTIEAYNFESLNTTANDNAMFYGKAFTTGTVKIKGVAPNIKMDINATTNRKTEIAIPLSGKSELSESNFIRFVEIQKPDDPFEKYELEKKINRSEFISTFSGLKMDFDLTVTPEAKMQIVFDQKIGDEIKGTGRGNINLTFDGSNFKMFGKYTIEKGDYLFTLQNIINKKFDIEKDGTISWTGDPFDADVNLNAIYNKDLLKASLYSLNHKYIDYKNKIPVYCRIFMTGKLMNPTIKWDIYLPTADQSTRNLLANEINTEEELNNQFIYLIFWNDFLTKTETSNTPLSQSNQGIAAVGVTGIEFFSNQLSNNLSKISKDVDIGINYHPGDEITNQEVEVALSTQILNERVTINGNVEMGGNKIGKTTTTANNTNNIVGDVDVNVKITNNGKLQFKFFNRSNENYFYGTSSNYTQGIGVFYKEDFNSFKELMKRYYQFLFTKKEDKQPVENKKNKEEYPGNIEPTDSTFVRFNTKNTPNDTILQ